ncbi:hypothetical protein OHB14_50305 [Streptomyces sp. NBC_01613]|uniref:hypothetical protein n=1 Tax=Streptomyces sp. NBC_01613 TaxID=2975896 RepID=UPI0038632A6D
MGRPLSVANWTPRRSSPPLPLGTATFETAQRRHPDHRRRWITLVDGADHQLDRIQHEAARRDVKFDIVVDFVHVLE